MSRPCFITLEGTEGAGKTTQARRLAASLALAGLPVLLTREPGGAPGAERLRRLLLHGDAGWAPQAETLLHFAARAEHLAVTMRPALAAGLCVVCDRFTDSTMAYQGHGQGADRAEIGALGRLVGLTPDLTIMLRLPLAVALRRLAARAGAQDRYERLGTEFFIRVEAGFRAIAAAEPERCVTIDAEATEEVVAARIWATVGERLGIAS